jgi:hypothetical protein
MLFFRSEEQVREWCEERGYPVRPLATIDQLWGMAMAFYGDRLQENARRPKPDEIRSIFAGLGLYGDFWDPLSDSFGSSPTASPPNPVRSAT